MGLRCEYFLGMFGDFIACKQNSKIIFKKVSYNQRQHCMRAWQRYLMAAFLIALPQLTQGCCLPVCPVCQNQTGTRADH